MSQKRVTDKNTRPAPLDERGVALPLALLGLVVVSLMVTAVLLTSSTEAAISSAHRDAVRDLHVAGSGLERYVAEKAVDASLGGTGLAAIAADPFTDHLQVTVSMLSLHRETLANGGVRQTEKFALVAEPSDGRGRSVGTMVDAVREVPPFTLDVKAGITVGGDLKVAGSSAVSDRSAACNLDGAENAIQVSDGSTVRVDGGAQIDGAVDTATYTRDQMVAELLGGRSLADAVKLATIRFGAGEFAGSASSYDASGPKPQSDSTNWGCPVGLGDDCELLSLGGSNTTYMPSVAIDAGGGTVSLNGDHGQGVLIIHNGSLNIQGNFVYKGILLVEDDLDVRGTGGSTAKIEGAVLALGATTNIEDSVTGNAVITYNKCAIDSAKDAFNTQGVGNAPQTFADPTFAWFEVVR